MLWTPHKVEIDTVKCALRCNNNFRWHCVVTAQVKMDALSLKFAKESALRQVEECTDLAELKKLTSSLVRGHFESRALISQLLLQGPPRAFSTGVPDDAPPPALG